MTCKRKNKNSEIEKESDKNKSENEENESEPIYKQGALNNFDQDKREKVKKKLKGQAIKKKMNIEKVKVSQSTNLKAGGFKQF